MDIDDLPELPHDFSEVRTGPEYVMQDGYEDPPKPVGNGTVECARCGLVLPATDGRIEADWKKFVNGIDCAERLVDIIDAL